MLCNDVVTGLPKISREKFRNVTLFCHTCAVMKDRRMSFRKTLANRVKANLHTMHVDTCGPVKQNGLYGTRPNIRYGCSLIDDNSSFCWVFVFSEKLEVPKVLKELLTQIEREHGAEIVQLRSDGGTEFNNRILHTYCKGNGIRYQKSNPYYKEENGSAERDFQTKFSKIKCALRDAQLPAKWWPEVFHYMNYIQNRTPMARLGNRTPYEILYGKIPNVSMIQPWGCVCYAHVPVEVRKDKKLSARAIRCRLLGVSEDYKGYRLLDEGNNRFIVARDVTFDSAYKTKIMKDAFELKAEPLTTDEVREVDDLVSTADSLESTSMPGE